MANRKAMGDAAGQPPTGGPWLGWLWNGVGWVWHCTRATLQEGTAALQAERRALATERTCAATLCRERLPRGAHP